jgi:hypothetical protein
VDELTGSCTGELGGILRECGRLRGLVVVEGGGGLLLLLLLVKAGTIFSPDRVLRSDEGLIAFASIASMVQLLLGPHAELQSIFFFQKKYCVDTKINALSLLRCWLEKCAAASASCTTRADDPGICTFGFSQGSLREETVGRFS